MTATGQPHTPVPATGPAPQSADPASPVPRCPRTAPARTRAVRRFALLLFGLAVPVLAQLALVQTASAVSVPPLKAVAISAGDDHSCAIKSSRQLVCWGDNGDGELGVKTHDPYSRGPVPVPGMTDVKAVSTGFHNTCAIRASGQAFCWGINNYGEVGDGTSGSDRTRPTPVTGLTDAVAISAGVSFACAVRTDGTTWCWGRNSLGQLGDGSTNARSQPGQVPVAGGAFAVTTGEDDACVLVNPNSVAWCWGPTYEPDPEPMAPWSIPASGISSLATSGFHHCFVTGGDLRCFGDNSYGELGVGIEVNNPERDEILRTTPSVIPGMGDIRMVATGSSPGTCALETAGQVWCWGRNNGGQLGTGDRSDRDRPAKVAGLGDATALAVGEQHACAIRRSGVVVCWGDNRKFQLGWHEGFSALKPVVVPSGSTVSAALAAPTVKPRRVTVRRGRSRTFTVTVRNRNNGVARNTRVCVKAPAKAIKVKRCVKLGEIGGSKVKRAGFRVKVRPKAKAGQKVKLKFTVGAAGLPKQAVVAILKVS